MYVCSCARYCSNHQYYVTTNRDTISSLDYTFLYVCILLIILFPYGVISTLNHIYGERALHTIHIRSANLDLCPEAHSSCSLWGNAKLYYEFLELSLQIVIYEDEPKGSRQ